MNIGKAGMIANVVKFVGFAKGIMKRRRKLRVRIQGGRVMRRVGKFCL